MQHGAQVLTNERVCTACVPCAEFPPPKEPPFDPQPEPPELPPPVRPPEQPPPVEPPEQPPPAEPPPREPGEPPIRPPGPKPEPRRTTTHELTSGADPWRAKGLLEFR